MLHKSVRASPLAERQSQKKPKLKIVLLAGGAKAIGYVGVYEGVLEMGYKPEEIEVEGHSGGAIAGWFIATGQTTEKFEEAMLSGITNRFDFFNWLLSLTPGDPFSVFFGGPIDLRPLLAKTLAEWHIEPNDRLTVVAYDALHHRFVKMKNSDLPWPSSTAASCALPGMMRSIWHLLPPKKEKALGMSAYPLFWGPFAMWSAWSDYMSRLCLLVDPGVVRYDPTEDVDVPTIVCVLQAATEEADYPTNLWDRYLHDKEVRHPHPCTEMVGNPDKVVFLPLGHPQISGLNLSVPKDMLLSYIEDCRLRTIAAITKAQAEGRLGATVN